MSSNTETTLSPSSSSSSSLLLIDRFRQHQQSTQQFYEIPLSSVIKRFLFQWNREFQELKSLSGQPTVDNKRRILQFIQSSRRKFAKLVALTGFLNEHPSVPRYLALRVMTEEALKPRLADRLFQMQSSFSGARLPPHDCLGALQTLCQLNAPTKYLPVSMNEWRLSAVSLHTAQAEYLNNVIRWLLCAGDDYSPTFSSFLRLKRIGDGYCVMIAPREFEIKLTAVFDPSTSQWSWMLLDVKIFVNIQIASNQLDQLKYQCNSILQPTASNCRPIRRVYEFLHKFCLQLSLALLHEQAARCKRSGSLDVDVELSADHHYLLLTFWPQIITATESASSKRRKGFKVALELKHRNSSSHTDHELIIATTVENGGLEDSDTNHLLSIDIDPSRLDFERLASKLVKVFASRRLQQQQQQQQQCRTLAQGSERSESEINPHQLELRFPLLSTAPLTNTPMASLSVCRTDGRFELKLVAGGLLTDPLLTEVSKRLTADLNQDGQQLRPCLLRLSGTVVVRLLGSMAASWQLQCHQQIPLQTSPLVTMNPAARPEQRCFLQFPTMRTAFIVVEAAAAAPTESGASSSSSLSSDQTRLVVEYSLLCTRLHLNQGAVSYEPFSKQSLSRWSSVVTGTSDMTLPSLRSLIELMRESVPKAWLFCLAETLYRQLKQLDPVTLADYSSKTIKDLSELCKPLPVDDEDSGTPQNILYRLWIPGPADSGAPIRGVIIQVCSKKKSKDIFGTSVCAILQYQDAREAETILHSANLEDCVQGFLERTKIISVCLSLAVKRFNSKGEVSVDLTAEETVLWNVNGTLSLKFRYDIFRKRFRVSSNPVDWRKRSLCAFIQQQLGSDGDESLIERVVNLNVLLEKELLSGCFASQLGLQVVWRTPQFARLYFYSGKYALDLRLPDKDMFIIADGCCSVFDPLGLIVQQSSSLSSTSSFSSPTGVSAAHNTSPISAYNNQNQNSTSLQSISTGGGFDFNAADSPKRIPRISVLFESIPGNYWRQKRGFRGSVPFSLLTPAKALISHLGYGAANSRYQWLEMVLIGVADWIAVHECFDAIKPSLTELNVNECVVDMGSMQISFSIASVFMQISYSYQTFDWRVQFSSRVVKNRTVDLSAYQKRLGDALNSWQTPQGGGQSMDPLRIILNSVLEFKQIAGSDR